MKVSIIGESISLSKETRDDFRARCDVSVVEREPHRETILRHAHDAFGLITYGRIDRSLLEELPMLQFLCLLSTGHDDALARDVTKEYAVSRQLCICYTPDAATSAVAEYTLAALLSGLRRLTTPIEKFLDDSHTHEEYQSLPFRDTIVGIIGLGAIGSQLSLLLRSLGCTVISYTRNPERQRNASSDISFVSLEELCRDSNAIAITCEHNSETHHLFGASCFALVKEDVVLVNSARPEILDLESTHHFLKEHKQACAILDEITFVEETDHPLLTLPNFYATPHIAFYTEEALHRYTDIALKNVEAFVSGSPINLIPLS